MKGLIRIQAVLLALMAISSRFAYGQVPQLINYQGILIDPTTSEPMLDGTYQMIFSIYDVASGGSAIWTETQNVQTQSGIYSVLLGSITPLTTTIFSGSIGTSPKKYLGIKVGEDPEMIPRKQIVSVAYAYTAESVSGGSNIFPSEGYVGIGTKQPSAKLHVYSADGVLFEGYSDTGAIPQEGTGNRMMWYPAKAAFRAGGVGDEGRYYWDADSIGDHSIAAGLNTIAKGAYSTAMGDRSKALGDYSTAIGHNNRASAPYSVAMGSESEASGGGAIAIGTNTKAIGDYCTAMGLVSEAKGYASTAMGSSTVSSSTGSTAMGSETSASGYASTAIGWGASASGWASMSIGDHTNARGYASFAAGCLAKANHDGCFVWRGYYSTEDSVASTGIDQFIIYARGGMGIGTMSPNYTLDVAGDINFTGSIYQNGSPFSGSSLWSQNGDDIYYTNGNVGIGTTSPARKLHVNDVLRLQPRAYAPANPSEGDMYMDSTTHKLMVFDGTAWQACW